VRKDFIDKFWIALGWDVYHEHQTNPYEQDVKAEKNVDVKGRIKKADYAFSPPISAMCVSSSKRKGRAAT
jgi:adenine-specific DNA-methyltransferase